MFDWAWANAYEQHGLAYYPKAVVAVPFTPVPGTRLLARERRAARCWCRRLLDLVQKQRLSSLHLLFGADEDIAACAEAGMMLRTPSNSIGRTTRIADFDAFLASLSHDKRKKIRQERRKVREAGVRFRWSRGADITRRRLGFLLPLLRPHLPRARQPALPDPRLLPAHRPEAARGLAALRGRARRPGDC